MNDATDRAEIYAAAGAILAATDMAEIVAPTVLRAYADAEHHFGEGFAQRVSYGTGTEYDAVCSCGASWGEDGCTERERLLAVAAEIENPQVVNSLVDKEQIMTDLITWPRAQLDADEQVARECERWAPSPWVGSFKQVTSEPAAGETRSIASTNAAQVSHHIEHWEPARALRQIQAHRTILDLHRPDHGKCTECGQEAEMHDWMPDWPCPTVKALISIYSDRDGYRESRSA